MLAKPQTTSDIRAGHELQAPFLRACRGLPNQYTPIWLMRQAGRFLPEYRAIRSKMSFLELCKSAQTAAQVTVMAVEKLEVDAAIIFADILLILEPMGVGLSFSQGDGPLIDLPVRSSADVDRLTAVEPVHDLAFVYDAIKLTTAALKPEIPLIGFAGAPFTLASYLIEGGSSKYFAKTKSFMYREPQAWRKLMTVLVQATVKHLRAQKEAGAQALQLFDSWVGCLSVDDYQNAVLPYVQMITRELRNSVPIIYFGTGASALLPAMSQAGADVIGLDWRVDLEIEWSKIGFNTPVQGNLDPCVLFAEKEEIAKRACQILHKAGGRPGHIFNLGHGVLPETPVDNVRFLVEAVREKSRK
jgi:uroporphyrinogen decarboxylase